VQHVVSFYTWTGQADYAGHLFDLQVGHYFDELQGQRGRSALLNFIKISAGNLFGENKLLALAEIADAVHY
jgi:hypothetical protein